MPGHGQRTTEESSAAGSEALRGAIVGGAKVRTHRNEHPHPHPSVPIHMFSKLSQHFRSTDNTLVIVGTSLWRSRYSWILSLTHLQKLDHPIQSVRPACRDCEIACVIFTPYASPP